MGGGKRTLQMLLVVAMAGTAAMASSAEPVVSIERFGIRMVDVSLRLALSLSIFLSRILSFWLCRKVR